MANYLFIISLMFAFNSFIVTFGVMNRFKIIAILGSYFPLQEKEKIRRFLDIIYKILAKPNFIWPYLLVQTVSLFITIPIFHLVMKSLYQ